MGKHIAPFCLVLFAVIAMSVVGSPAIAKSVSTNKDQVSTVDDYELAKILYEQREYDQSIKVLESILSRDPNNSKASELLNKIYKAKGCVSLHRTAPPREKEIVLGKDMYYKKGVLEENRIKAEEYYLFGTTYYKQGEYEKSAAKFRQVLNIDPTDKRAKQYYVKARKMALAKLMVERSSENSSASLSSQKAARLLDEEELDKRINKLIVSDEEKEKGPDEDYRLGPGDELQVIVVGQSNMSGTLAIEKNGMIRLPVVNEEIKADGLTTTELAKELEKILGKYVKQPSVLIKIVKFESKKFYIIGQIGKPNSYPMKKNTMRLIDCLYESGLPLINKGAALTRVRVIKPHPVYPIVRKVDTMDLLMEGKYVNNIIIEPGDTIYVPWKVGTKISDFIKDVTDPISDALRPVYYLDTIRDWND